MKVTATGVTEEIGFTMFELWVDQLKRSQTGATVIDVRFVLENENGRT